MSEFFDSVRMLWGVFDYNHRHLPHNGRFARRGYGLTYQQTRVMLEQEKIRDSSGWGRKSLERHFEDHKEEYPGWTIKEYSQWATDLLEAKPDGEKLLGMDVGSDFAIRYFRETNDFACERGRVRTLYRPKEGAEEYKKRLSDYLNGRKNTY